VLKGRLSFENTVIYTVCGKQKDNLKKRGNPYMISTKMQDAINEQINAELFSAYLYLSMSAYFQEINLAGFARWMEFQAAEEFFHAKKFYNYLVERGGRVLLKAIAQPETEWNSPQEVFEATLQHEQKVTGLIIDLMDLAIAEKDHATNIMLQWFVSEQVEEEATASEILEKLKLVGTTGNGIFMMDRELGQRTLNAAEYLNGDD
jgi:ferritin